MTSFRIIYNTKTGQHRWQLRTDNNEVVCHGETHPDREGAVRAAESLPRWVAEATTINMESVTEDGDDT